LVWNPAFSSEWKRRCLCHFNYHYKKHRVVMWSLGEQCTPVETYKWMSEKWLLEEKFKTDRNFYSI
jgi:hypothetical protein